MPLIEAAGTSVERIRPDSVKNSTPPERIWLSVSVFRTQLAVGEDLKVKTAIGLLFYCGRHLPRLNVHRVRFWKIVRIFVSPLRLLSASDGRSGRGGNHRQACAGKQAAPSYRGF